MKVSEITKEDIANYIRDIDLTDPAEDKFIAAIQEAAIAYINNRLNVTTEKLDQWPEMAIAVFALCADMYDNRSTIIESGTPNQTVESIINMHDYNFL